MDNYVDKPVDIHNGHLHNTCVVNKWGLLSTSYACPPRRRRPARRANAAEPPPAKRGPAKPGGAKPPAAEPQRFRNRRTGAGRYLHHRYLIAYALKAGRTRPAASPGDVLGPRGFPGTYSARGTTGGREPLLSMNHPGGVEIVAPVST